MEKKDLIIKKDFNFSGIEVIATKNKNIKDKLKICECKLVNISRLLFSNFITAAASSFSLP
tara:strand:- start:335 stop:517 length:183 start_codon:yes stop_codon:yes gene_type:complete